MRALEQNGIVPSKTKTYKRDRLLDAAATVARRPYMLCHKNFVMEFRFCFTRELQPIDCSQQSVSCKENLLLNPVRVRNTCIDITF